MTADGSDDAGTIGRHMARGTLWMVSMRWAIRLIGLVNTAIIARVLAPADFGLVALAMVLVDLAITMTDGDIDMALVRVRTPDPGLCDTGWTLKIAAGFITGAILWSIARIAAARLGDPRIADVMRIAALKPLILGFENIAVTEFRRELRFDREFRYLVLQRVVSFFTGLALVFSLRNYLALAWTMPVSAVITVALSYLVAKGRPRLALSHWRELWLFSRWQMTFNAARLLGERCDQIILGRLAGVELTGLYAVAFDIALMPTREIMLPAGRALMPAYARIAQDERQLREAFSLVLGFAALVAGSAGIGICCVARDAVLLMLGDQWEAAVPFVRWLGIYGALEGAWLMLDPFLIAGRHEKALALANLGFSLVTIPVAIAAAMIYGAEALPLARIAVITLTLAGVFLRMIGWGWISPRGLLSVLWRPMVAAGAMALAIEFLRLAPDTLHVVSLLHDVAIGGVVYIATLLGLWRLSGRPPGAEASLVEAVKTARSSGTG